MDSSDWSNLNQSVVISYTKKKFYNTFLFKMSYRVPGARLITYAKNLTELGARIEVYNDRVDNPSTYNRFYQFRPHYKKSDLTQLTVFYNLYNIKSNDYKFRIESETIMMYSTSQENLYNLATGTLNDYRSGLTEVSLVESDAALTLLDQGYTLIKKPTTYPYKVRLREGFQAHYERHGLATYLKNLGIEVKVTEYILRQLSSNNKYFHGGYVYVNDPKLIDMLRLVSPAVVGTVDQLVTQ
jgi:hypothetical protein